MYRRDGLDVIWKIIIYDSASNQTPAVCPVSSHFTDWAVWHAVIETVYRKRFWRIITKSLCLGICFFLDLERCSVVEISRRNRAANILKYHFILVYLCILRNFKIIPNVQGVWNLQACVNKRVWCIWYTNKCWQTLTYALQPLVKRNF